MDSGTQRITNSLTRHPDAINIIKEEFGGKGVNVVKIILFGSRARGDFREDSDWDLLVLVDKEISSKEDCEISGEIYRRLAKFEDCYEIIPASERFFNDIKRFIGSVYYDADKEGIVVWS